MRDQCPHCFKKFEQEEWINRTGCPYCGKRILLEVAEEKPEVVSFFASLPKVPPRLDWFVIPLGVLLWLPLPFFRWIITSFDLMTFGFGPMDSTQLKIDTLLSAGIGGALAWLYFKAKRRVGDDLRKLTNLRLKMAIAFLCIVVLYLKV